MQFNFSLQQRIKLGLNNTVFGLSGTIFNFLFSILIVRMFSPSLWGQFTQSMLLLILFNLFTGWGNKDYLLREFSRNHHLAVQWQTSFISRLVLFLPVIPLIYFITPDPVQSLLLLLWIFSNFITRSFDSVIVFERKFKEAIIIESAGFVMLLLSLFLFKELISLNSIILLFVGSSALKSILYFIQFRRNLLHSLVGRFDAGHLRTCLPYFLPPFIGFLQARSDTFAIALQLSSKELGEYYVLLSLLSYCHATAVLAITPFLKNIYRINSVSFQKIKIKFTQVGLLWSVVCMVGIYGVITFVYHIQLPVYTYFIAWFTLPPYFFYFLLMQDLLRQDKPSPIVIINLIAAALNFLISVILIKYYGFTGGVISCAIMQWMLLVGFSAARYLKPRTVAVT
ncbi:flippase [soil metagenome]